MEQEKYQEAQILDYQIKQLQKIIENINTQLNEISNTIDALKDFEKLENDTEVLFPVANGIFASGKIIDNKILKINIGSNVNVEKSVAETISMMQKQAKDIELYKEEIEVQLQKFINKMNEFQTK
jgi:prefoldin alpha subunit